MTHEYLCRQPESQGILTATEQQIGRKLDYTRKTSQRRREKQCTGARGGGARGGGGASLVPELLDAPVLLGDFRLELINTSFRGLEDALHLGLVRER